MATIRLERPGDVAAREALLDVSYGPVRFTKTSQRLREGRLPELALVATEGRRLVGTVRLWSIAAGPGRPALLLGPLAVAPDCRNRGIGSTLVRQALRTAARRGHDVVLLVGDAPYYGRFGFSAEKTAALRLPARVFHGHGRGLHVSQVDLVLQDLKAGVDVALDARAEQGQHRPVLAEFRNVPEYHLIDILVNRGGPAGHRRGHTGHQLGDCGTIGVHLRILTHSGGDTSVVRWPTARLCRRNHA